MKKTLQYNGKDVATVYVMDREEKIQSYWFRRTFYECQRNGLLPYIAANYKGGVMIDAGANIGNHSLFFAGVCGASVIAFEPVPNHFYKLERNLKENPQLNIAGINIALGDKKREVGMSKSDVDPKRGGAMMNEVDLKGKGIQMDRLDNAVKGFDLEGLTFIKIDVEHFQMQTLAGAKKTITKYKPDLSVECPTLEEFDECLKWFTKIGYKVVKHDGKPLVLNSTATYIFKPA